MRSTAIIIAFVLSMVVAIACDAENEPQSTSNTSSSSSTGGGARGVGVGPGGAASGGAGTTAAGGAGTTSTGGSAGGTGGVGGAPVDTVDFLYVADIGGISAYKIEDAGELTEVGATALQFPDDLAASSERRVLYVGLDFDGVGSFSIDGTTGLLTQMGGIVPSVGSWFFPHPSRDEILIANFGSGNVNLYSLNGDGSVNSLLDSHFVGTNPRAVTISPSGSVAYATNLADDKLIEYDLTVPGVLGSPITIDSGGSQPYAMIHHPTLPVLYGANRHDDSISVYDVANDGGLTLRNTISTVPTASDGAGSACSDIHITPNGRFLFASNDGHDSMAMFTVTPSGDLLTNSHIPTEEGPESFDVSPNGHFVYVAGRNSDKIAAYAVNGQGQLVPLSIPTYDSAGGSPRSVIAVGLPIP